MESHEPKISIVEIFLGLAVVGIADLVELLLLAFGLDDFWISDLVAFPITQLYLRLKGVRGNYSLIANCIELIPYVGALPLRTIGFLATIYIDRHPATQRVVNVAKKGTATKSSLLEKPPLTPKIVGATAITPDAINKINKENSNKPEYTKKLERLLEEPVIIDIRKNQEEDEGEGEYDYRQAA